MRKIRVAILGQGRSGRDIHGKYLSTDERYSIAAVADPMEDRRKRAEEEYGCESFEHYSSLFGRNDIDLVINTTPSHLHVPVSLEFLEKGFNVLCDKPLARTVAEVDKLIEASKKYDRILAIFQQSRYAPYYQQIRKIIASGVLGRIIQISVAFNGFSRRWDWQCLRENYGGSLLNTGPHPLDQALQLLGTDEIPEVKCYMDRVNTLGDAEDYVKLIMKAPGEPVIDLEISSCCPYPHFTYNIQAEFGGINAKITHIDWKYYIPSEAPRQELIREPLSKDDGTPAYCSDRIKWYEESWDFPEGQDMFQTMTGQFYSMLYRTIAEGAELEITPAQVRRQIAVIEECHRQNPMD
jgi:scyllo-inositol 2-dehydrogenase (NADP+)